MTGRAKNLIFTCPVTGENVQHRLECEHDNGYEAVPCFACSRIHFMNRQTGKLLDGELPNNR
jgi:hypothetical protein